MSLGCAETRPQPQKGAIAIVGMACRLPGGSTSPERLWDLLVHGESGYCEVPEWRYKADSFYNPDSSKPGSINSTGGHFIQEDVRNFENSFFGINNLEAVSIDPEQRKILEVAFECFESAGVPVESLAGANVGCYVANFASEYASILLEDPEMLDRYSATGATATILANRITHVFDLHGPSMVIDTACSASLYALHHACVALEVGDCASALVASASLIQSPQHQMLATKAGILSNTASCKTFDISADGYGRAEGVGALYLKRVEDAIRDRDPIRAVIRGTAVNSNGRTSGLMLPSALGQQQVIEKAYSRANLTLDETDYVEAHGTGTAVGDPIEIEAISKSFTHRSGRPTLVGSVKTVLGHSEANSGISSIIKSVLALEHRLIPPTIGIKTINPKILQGNFNVDIVQTTVPWPQTRCPRVSINSFGFGGANSHVILESADSHTHPLQFVNGETGMCHNRTMILPVSARSIHSLDRRIKDLKAWEFPVSSTQQLASISHTLANRRSQFAFRGYMVVDEEKSTKNVAVVRDSVSSTEPARLKQKIAFVYTGQGAQWPGMGKELYLNYPVFQKTIDELDAFTGTLEHNTLPSLAEMIMNDVVKSSVEFEKPAVAQVLCTAVQIGLTDLLCDWNIQPSAVVGHSSGEIAAAYAAQLITKQRAMVLALYRGYVVSSYSHPTLQGAMLAANLDEDTAQSYLVSLELQTKLTVACVNSPSNMTFSGDEHAIDSLKAVLDDQSIFSRKLRTGGTAYHSHHMQGAIGARYEQLITNPILCDAPIQNTREDPVMVSSVDGCILTRKRAAQASYWKANLENPVQFYLAVKNLHSIDSCCIVEIGPHPALHVPIKQTLETLRVSHNPESSLVHGTLFRNKNSTLSMLELAGNLFMCGQEPDFDKINNIHYVEKRVMHDLPSYAWDYGNSMPLKEPQANQRLRNRKYPHHELLGSLNLDGNMSTLTWRNRLSVRHVQWLKDHCLGTTIVFPAAGYLAMIIEAMCQIQGVKHVESTGLSFRHTKFSKALTLVNGDEDIELFTEMRRLPISMAYDSKHWWQFKIESVAEGRPTDHVAGQVSLDESLLPRFLVFPSETMELQAKRVWYQKLTDIGMIAGPEFKIIDDIFFDRSGQKLIAMTKLPMKRGWYNDRRAEHDYIAHPTVIDAMLQTVFFAAAGGKRVNLLSSIPVSIEQFSMAPVSSINFSSSDPWTISANAAQTGFDQLSGNAEIYNSQNQVLFQIKGERAIVYQDLQEFDISKARMPILRICWKPDVDLINNGLQLSKYLGTFTHHTGALNILRMEDRILAGCLDLVAHKSPREVCLSIGIHPDALELQLQTLGASSLMRRFTSFHYAAVGESGDLQRRDAPTINAQTEDSRKKQSTLNHLVDYGLVVADLTTPASKLLNVTKLFAEFSARTRFILAIETMTVPELQSCGRPYTKMTLMDKTFAIVGPSSKIVAIKSDIYMVGNDSGDQLHIALQEPIERQIGKTPKSVNFKDITASTFEPRAIIIFTAECDATMLSKLLPGNMIRLKHMIKECSQLLWVTRGNVTQGQDPEAMLAFGLARAVMLEQPALKFACFDIDQGSSERATASNIVTVLQALASQDHPDTEFAQTDGMVKVSRFIPDEHLNRAFHQTIEKQSSKTHLCDAGVCELTIGKAGQLDTIRFKPVRNVCDSTLSAEEVEIDTKCFGINAKDLYLLNAKFDSSENSGSCEFGGVVRRIGSTTSDLSVGDRVMVMVPGKYRTREVVPSWACVKLLPHEDFESMSTVPLVFMTAIYALKYRANLQSGESVLIHSATGGLGIAAIQIANLIGAKVFATAGSIEKRNYLTETFGIPADHVFSSRDSSFLPSILAATHGEGVDVVLNSLTGDLLQDSFNACAPLGRFIELGKKDILENGRLDMSSFSRSVAFIAFDMIHLLHSKHKRHHAIWKSICAEIVQLLRAGDIQPITPVKVFDISQTTKAFRYFSQPSRMGKVAISLNDPTSLIDLMPMEYTSVFDSNRTYLMIGGLGGIGRSVSRWMHLRGARNFVYLSRSGTSQPAAQQLIDDLHAMGAKTQVILGDVSVAADVETAVNAASTPIGGVVQASMSIKATHWESLTYSDWNGGIDAKTKGCWNLHHALSGKQGAALDFFLLLSSLAGSIGSVTESNYCAANAFMDSFARFRRANGLPATSIGLGVITEIGYLHDHPEMEAVNLRRGMQGIPEHEMLRLIDLAISEPNSQEYCGGDELMQAHMLTGLEMKTAISQILENGTSTVELTLQDPRASVLAAYVDREVTNAGGRSLLSNDTSSSTNSTQNRKLPRELREMTAQGQSLETAVSNILAKKFGNIVMLSTEKLKLTDPLVSFGLDSMLAAEFRTYVFQSTGVDLSFMKLLSSGATIQTLAATISAEIKGAVA